MSRYNSCLFILIVVGFQSATVQSRGISLVGNTTEIESRNGRFFGQMVTKLILENLIVTSIVPSSCVAIEPSLPPCRTFRFLNFGRWPVSTEQAPVIESTQLPTLPNSEQYDSNIENETEIIESEKGINDLRRRRKPPQKTTTPPTSSSTQATPPLPNVRYINIDGSITPEISEATINNGWGDYFNFFRGTTVTRTVTRLLTETYLDPSRVITFSVKHCLPTRLPFELPKCVDPNEKPLVPAASTEQSPTTTEEESIKIEPTSSSSIIEETPSSIPSILEPEN